MKNSLKHCRTLIQAACNSAASEHSASLSTLPGDGAGKGAGGRRHCCSQASELSPSTMQTSSISSPSQFSYEQRHGRCHTFKLNSWLLSASTEQLEELHPQLEHGPVLPKGQRWGLDCTSGLHSLLLPPGCHFLWLTSALIWCSCITLDQAAGKTSNLGELRERAVRSFIQGLHPLTEELFLNSGPWSRAML